MLGTAQSGCVLCNGRGGMLGRVLLPLPEEFCTCVTWQYEPAPDSGPLDTYCARCNRPFTAFVPDDGGQVEGDGLCPRCFLGDVLVVWPEEMLAPPDTAMISAA